MLLVGGAERRRALRHPVPSAALTGRDVLAVVVGVRGGLNVACSRTASAGDPDPELAARHLAACAVETALITASRPEDTFVVTRSGPRPVTYTADWPVVPGGRPAILPT